MYIPLSPFRDPRDRPRCRSHGHNASDAPIVENLKVRSVAVKFHVGCTYEVVSVAALYQPEVLLVKRATGTLRFQRKITKK
jgi:hypothetical protein